MTIPGYSRYDISCDGVVTEISTGTCIKQYKSDASTLVRIRADGQTEKCAVTVHRLLALAFIGPCPDGCVAAFKHGRELSAGNVEWISRRDLSIRTRDLAVRKPKTSNGIILKNTQRVYEELQQCDVPVTIVSLANTLGMPYSTVRYSIYGLIAVGKARATKGGYEAVCSD